MAIHQEVTTCIRSTAGTVMIDIPLPGCVWVILATLGAGCGDPAPAVRDAVDDGADAPFGMPVIPQSSDFCGVDSAAGVYRGPCNLVVQGTQVSTLCDEATHTCVAPHADCADGWCRIPAASYLSGLGPDWGGFSVDSEDAAMTIVPRTYAIQATEVTVDDFVKVMGYTPPGAVNCSDCPVTNVSIFKALSYANRMSDAMGLNECCARRLLFPSSLTGTQAWTCVGASFAGPECDGIRLPSRAEWGWPVGGGVMCSQTAARARTDACRLKPTTLPGSFGSAATP
ncbi:MAG: SUMF1/EgtB/PvdO family nonheme iron enzyme [Myxococcota bacterium]